MSSGTGSAGRWVLLVAMLGASGWASFTLYERTTQASPASSAPVADPQLEALLAEAYKHLAADDLDSAKTKLDQAAGVAADDPRIHEGRVLVAVRHAERRFWELTVSRDEASRDKRVEDLDHAVHDAREVIAEVRLRIEDRATIERVTMHERRLNTMLVVAFARAGDIERARGALAARLEGHPQRELFEGFLGAPSPAASASASASASARAAPPVPTPPPVANPGTPSPQPYYEPHYELDHEPSMEGKPKTAGELELPAPD